MSDSADLSTLNPALHAQLEAQVGYLSTLSRHGVELLTRVSELNMQLARQSLDDMLSTSQQLASCSDPMQLSAVAIRGMQPAGEHLRNYQQQMMAALADVQARLGQAPLFSVSTPPAAAARRRS